MSARVVVAVALFRGGRVLAARRRDHAPPGGWEFPGGTVEPGEDPPGAAVREIAEELGYRVGVAPDPLGTTAIPGGATLVLLDGWLLDSDPAALDGGHDELADHDELAWLDPGDPDPAELDRLGWLDADARLLPALRQSVPAGRVLPGGNVGGAMLVRGTVRRPSGPWTPIVHALMHHLRGRGLAEVPEPLGRDGFGREVLEFVDGVTPDSVDGLGWRIETFAPSTIGAVGRWLARVHLAVASFRAAPPDGPPELRWRFGVGPPGPGQRSPRRGSVQTW